MPIMKRPHRRHQTDPRVRAAWIEGLSDVGDRAQGFHGAVTSANARYICSSSGAALWMAARWASIVAQSPRAIGPVRSKPLSMVRRISGISASGGAPADSSRRFAE